jgi:proteasome lid subunit RPN8/RPN11
MEIAIASTALATIVGHAAVALPDEACGVLVGGAAGIAVAIPARNVAADPARAFEIDPVTLLGVHRAARGEGRRIVGWYHSHPNGVGQPSATDAARAEPDGRLWLIAAAGAVSAWRAGAAGTVHGRFTPVALVAD